MVIEVAPPHIPGNVLWMLFRIMWSSTLNGYDYCVLNTIRHLMQRYLSLKFGSILKLMSSVDIDSISRYTGTSSLLGRLNTDIASNLFWAKTALI